MTAEPCPNCGVMIHKNGGCKHMQCVKCRHEFCWFCLGTYTGYRHNPGMKTYCVLAGFMKGLIAFFITSIFLLKPLSSFLNNLDPWIYSQTHFWNILYYGFIAILANITSFSAIAFYFKLRQT